MAKNFKIPTKKINSSDCIVHIGQVIENDQVVDKGKPYAVHENEWVKLLPVITMKESFALMRIANMGDTTSNADESLNEVCQSLANRIVDWNWTGIDGELLPKPYKNPEVFKDLLNEELIYLITASMGETESQAKNDSGLLPNTHSVESQKVNLRNQ
jgi:hypothetical protein